MKKKIIFIATISFIFLSSQNCIGQDEKNPIHWEYTFKMVSDTEADLIFEATIDENWHLYGQFFEDGGPIRLSFHYAESNDFEKIGKTSEFPTPKIIRDEIFEIDVLYFEKKATFTQRIKLTSNQSFTISGDMEYQVCFDNKCIMQNPEFKFEIVK